VSTSLALYNIAGDCVGAYDFGADGLNACINTSGFASGIYVAKIKVNGFERVQKVMMVK
jgi:hypothetical protein